MLHFSGLKSVLELAFSLAVVCYCRSLIYGVAGSNKLKLARMWTNA